MEYCPECESGEYAEGVCNSCGYKASEPKSKEVKKSKGRRT